MLEAVPAGHNIQLEAPLTSEYDPGAQSTQVAFDVAADPVENVPRGHSMHSADPAALQEPDGQLVQLVDPTEA